MLAFSIMITELQSNHHTAVSQEGKGRSGHWSSQKERLAQSPLSVLNIEYPRLAIYASRLIRFETIEPPRPPSWLRLFYTGVRWCLWPIAQTTHLLTSCLDDDLMHILCNCNANVLRVIALQLNALFDKTRNCILYQQKEVLNDTKNLAVYLDHIKSAKLNDFLSTFMLIYVVHIYTSVLKRNSSDL